MEIKLLNPIHPKIDDIKTQFSECLESGFVTNNGKYVKKFELDLKEYLSSKFKPLVFCNGEMALYNLIQAWKEELDFDHNESFKVLVPSFTFSGTVNAIVKNNLEPVFCDIDETMTIDLDKIDIVNNEVKMIIAVGAYGTLPNVEDLIDFSSKNNLVLILDNAPSFGAKYKNKFPSDYNVSEIWSFHATKVLSTMEGGGVLSDNLKIMKKLEYLRNFGQKEFYRGNIDNPGLNSKMQEISAIVGIYNLKNFNETILLRESIIKKYNKIFSELVLNETINTMKVSGDINCNYTNYPIIINEDAENFVKYMESKEIQVRRYYTAVHDLYYYKDRYIELNLDYTDMIKNSVIALPLHIGMTNNKIEFLFDSVKNYFR